jgi:hypothetical protein
MVWNFSRPMPVRVERKRPRKSNKIVNEHKMSSDEHLTLNRA